MRFVLTSMLLVLPIIIFQFYTWLHETFRCLVTKEHALTTTMWELMTVERLSERFDSAYVHHVLELWDRVKAGFNKCFLECNQKLNWECQEVSIPFDKLENATLMCLLSEGAHPTENDFLFLAINEVISVYNNFAERISHFCLSDDGATTNKKVFHPRFIIYGYGDAVKIGAVAPLSACNLNWVAECSWDSHNGIFNLKKVKSLLRDLINLEDQPCLISNPLDHLRETFHFRDDTVQSWDESKRETHISVDRYGNFLANGQDAQLVEEVHQLLSVLDMTTGDETIRRTIMDHFHCLDYKQIRSMMEGCRNVLDVLYISKKEKLFESLGSLLHDLVSTSHDDADVNPLQEMGFPTLVEKQSRLMLSLNTNEFFEIVFYCGYQLASEAYLFSNLPLYMNDPYTMEMKHELIGNLSGLLGEKSAKSVANHVDEFIRDILGFYERQLVNQASKTNELLQVFLVTNNFCDDSDPVFSSLPPTTSLRNYISLRQTLQQMKLSLLSCSTIASEFLPSTDCDSPANISLATTTRGHCWLWEDRSVERDGAPNDVDDLALKMASHDQWKLWFERAIPPIPGSDVVMADASSTVDEIAVTTQTPTPINNDTETFHVMNNNKSTIDDITADDIINLDINAEFYAARVLQRWWRRVTEYMSDNEFKYNVYSDDEEDADKRDSVENCGDNLSYRMSDYGPDAAVPTASSSSSFVLESEFLVESQQSDSQPLPWNVSYGTQVDEMRMRQCLDEHALPQVVADSFLSFGARSMDDICMFLAPGTGSTNSEFVEEFLSKFTPLDRLKLGNLVKSMSSSTTENDVGDLAPKIASHEQWKSGSERVVPTIPGSDVVMADAWSTVDETAATTQTATAVTTTQTPCTPINNDTETFDVMSDHKSTIDDSSRVANEYMSEHELRDDVYSDDDYDDYSYD
jgi:hypothetical protein